MMSLVFILSLARGLGGESTHGDVGGWEAEELEHHEALGLEPNIFLRVEE